MRQEFFPELPILFVDDEKEFLNGVNLNLKLNGISNIGCCDDSRQVISLINQKKYSIIFLDLSMPHMSGEDLLPKIVVEHPGIPVIILTAYDEVEKAVKCIKNGAFDYIVKPIDTQQLIKIIKHTLDIIDLKKENIRLKESILSESPRNLKAFSKIITQNSRMLSIFKYLEAIAESPMPVLITGETGVGKGEIASAVHVLSGRNGTFVEKKIGGLDNDSIVNALYGDKNGMYIDGGKISKCLLEQAENGTLFLDEIVDIPGNSQTRLLELINEEDYVQVPSGKKPKTNVRLITATSQNFFTLIKENKFKNDLYQRLNAYHVHIPPLRERKEDIPLLVDYFLTESAKDLKKKKPYAPPELFIILSKYNFPGNVRELGYMVYNAVKVHETGFLSLDSFKEKILKESGDAEILSTSIKPEEKKVTFGDSLPNLKELEKIYFNEVLKRADGKTEIAAKLVGLSKKGFTKRLGGYRK